MNTTTDTGSTPLEPNKTAALPTSGAELCNAVSQFIYYEVRLLDARAFNEWLPLLGEDFSYEIPLRFSHQPSSTVRASQPDNPWPPARDFSRQDQTYYQRETKASIGERIKRSFHPNAWADNPPATIRHLITNIELADIERDHLTVYSNFLLSYQRHQGSYSQRDGEQCNYVGQRVDRLQQHAQSFIFVSRKVLLNTTEIINNAGLHFYF